MVPFSYGARGFGNWDSLDLLKLLFMHGPDFGGRRFEQTCGSDFGCQYCVSCKGERSLGLTLALTVLPGQCEYLVDIVGSKSLLNEDSPLILYKSAITKRLTVLIYLPLHSTGSQDHKELWCAPVFLAFSSFHVADRASLP